MTYVLCELLSKRHDYFCAILGPVAQWIRHLTTNQGIPGSSPGRIGSFDLPKMRPPEMQLSHEDLYQAPSNGNKTQVHIISAGNFTFSTVKTDG